MAKMPPTTATMNLTASLSSMKNMDNSPERQSIIDKMMEIARRDAPWAWGLFPKQFSLHHSWVKNSKPNLMANNTLKYQRIDPELRTELQKQWNRPVRLATLCHRDHSWY